jgi:hypothetical protein
MRAFSCATPKAMQAGEHEQLHRATVWWDKFATCQPSQVANLRHRFRRSVVHIHSILFLTGKTLRHL